MGSVGPASEPESVYGPHRLKFIMQLLLTAHAWTLGQVKTKPVGETGRN